MYTKVKTPDEVARMREAGRMLATVLEALRQQLEPGMSTKDLSDIARQELRKLGGQPSFLGYPGGPGSFPDVLCVSVNEEVVHGIPSPTKIVQSGDVVSMDFGVTYRGMVTDAAISVIAGKPRDERTVRLLRDTEAALLAGVAELKEGVKTGDIAAAVQAVLDKGRYGIVRDLVGHGVGHELHEEPNIPNYGRAGTGVRLEAGMTIAIEPMATLGTHRVVIAPDGWTVVSEDNSLAAHFEHTILITQDGAQILTQL